MTLLDVLTMYAMLNNSDDMTLMLQDYALDNRLDRNVMNRAMIKELGAMRPYVNDTTIFKFALENFFDKWNYNIGKLIDTMYYSYDPIGNKNITRTLGETENRESQANINNTDTYTTNTDKTETISNTTEETVSAYDSSTYQPKNKSVSSTNDNTDQDVEHEGTTSSDIQSDVDTAHDLEETIKGKDGQSSYQELIKQERKLAEFNIYEWILKQMRRELFLLVY